MVAVVVAIASKLDRIAFLRDNWVIILATPRSVLLCNEEIKPKWLNVATRKKKKQLVTKSTRVNSVNKLAVMETVAEETTTTVRTKRQQKLTTALTTLAILLQVAIIVQTSRQAVYV